ncbi:MAG: MCE family protein [Rikenellaceae bacterium]|nr:MCE family protein [Rikenellaceae bacterium]
MKKEVKIGIYALLIFLASWAGIRFLSGADIFGRSDLYYAYYDDASGLQNASSVVIRGVKVGQVSSVTISADDPTKVEVALAISKEYKIPTDSKAKIFSAGLMGGQAVEIVLGHATTTLAKGDTINSDVEVGMFDAIATEFGDIKEKLVVMMDNINTTLVTLNTLVDSNNANISSAISNLNGILAELEKSEIVANLDSFTGTLKNNGEKIDSIVTNVGNLTASLDEQQMGVKLTEAVDNLSTLLEKFNTSEGTVGSLLNDKALYANLAQASENLSVLLDDLKQNPMRYVHFSLFGSSESKTEKKTAKAEKKAAKAEKKAAKALKATQNE